MFQQDDEEWIELVPIKRDEEIVSDSDSVEVIEAPKKEQSKQSLVNEPVKSSSEKKQEKKQEDLEQKVDELIHKLTFGDTLEGLQLRYNVSAQSIKAHNNLNSNDIYYLREIIIPFPKANHELVMVDNVLQEKLRKDYITKGFMNQLSPEDKSPKMANYYLEETNWDIYEAVKAYNSDREWQKQNPTLKPKRHDFIVSNTNRPNPYSSKQIPQKKIK